MHVTYMEVTEVEYDRSVCDWLQTGLQGVSERGVNRINLATSGSCKVASLRWPEATA
jgi:hypothetical protein